jgi:putative ABC transport system ATP-binding protein
VLTAYENVELPLLLTSLSRSDREKHVMMALDVVGLADRKDHTPRQLSGGQEQRVADRPGDRDRSDAAPRGRATGDLDKKSEEEVLTLLQRLNKEFKKAIVMVTHDPKAAACAARTVMLEKGALVSKP